MHKVTYSRVFVVIEKRLRNCEQNQLIGIQHNKM